ALIGQPEALLRDVHAQHPLQANGRTAAPRTLGVERFERADHRRPRRDRLNLGQKALAPGLLLLVGVLEVGKTGLLHEPWCRRLRGAIVSKARRPVGWVRRINQRLPRRPPRNWALISNGAAAASRKRATKNRASS